MTGIILRGIGGFYYVMDESGTVHQLRAQAKIRRVKLTPLVGDRVEFEPAKGDMDGWLKEILPRDNSLVRPSVANIDLIVLVAAAASPKMDSLLIDRMLISARKARIDAMLVINKCDLDRDAAEDIKRRYSNAGIDVMLTSAEKGEGVDALRRRLSGLTHAFGGQSGVGKSSLINALYGLELMVGRVSDKIERGKHTTRRCELISVEGGGRVLDTPGFSLLETDLIEPREVSSWYPEFYPYEGKCRFSPCFHAGEPDCCVKDALEEGAFPRERYESYIEILNEMKERWKNRYD
ncbi:MAG: ribosome small subunit-dependent GTPase A [Clostridia bacterium]|nr:ribosome small subunit-dependent GTPase A [Clostridia bacterium]MBQ2433442.1 ribosome small subunit-dependent GTPase A [Clostridia bacterium]MBQ5769561.1 ribosome small subunit-dependent GTPase A [Clostridia bacterium]